MIQEAKEMTAVSSQPSPPKPPSSVVKPQAPVDVVGGPLYSGYALTPGIWCIIVQYGLINRTWFFIVCCTEP